MLKRRFRLNNIALSDPEGMRATDEALNLGLAEDSEVDWGKRASVFGPNDLPACDDADPEPFHNLRRVAGGQRKKPSARSASWLGRIPKEEAKRLLIDEFGAECWGCGWEVPTFPGGERDLALLGVDRIWARNDAATASANEGGSDELYNLALLHPTCNRTKSNRMTLERLRRRNADDQRLYKGLNGLVHLGRAQQFRHVENPHARRSDGGGSSNGSPSASASMRRLFHCVQARRSRSMPSAKRSSNSSLRFRSSGSMSLFVRYFAVAIAPPPIKSIAVTASIA